MGAVLDVLEQFGQLFAEEGITVRATDIAAILDRVSGELDVVARNWGVKIEMVKIQKVQADELEEVLAQKKNADFKNKEIVITAKAKKQTKIINAEGKRDQQIREAEGESQRIIASGKCIHSFLWISIDFYGL